MDNPVLKMLSLGKPLVFQQPTLNGQCESVAMALDFNVGYVGEGGGCKQKGGQHLGSRTPVYHTRLDGWPPREMLRKRGTLQEVIQALQLLLFQHIHPAIFQVGDIRFLT